MQKISLLSIYQGNDISWFDVDNTDRFHNTDISLYLFSAGQLWLPSSAHSGLYMSKEHRAFEILYRIFFKILRFISS